MVRTPEEGPLNKPETALQINLNSDLPSLVIPAEKEIHESNCHCMPYCVFALRYLESDYRSTEIRGRVHQSEQTWAPWRINGILPRGREVHHDKHASRSPPVGCVRICATARQLSGAPDAISEKYDIAAKAEHPVSRDEMLRMIQALLADRFKLILASGKQKGPCLCVNDRARRRPRLRHRAATDDERSMPRIPARAGELSRPAGAYSRTNPWRTSHGL